MIKNCTIISQDRTYEGKIDTDTGKVIIQEDSIPSIIFRMEDNPGLEIQYKEIFNRDRVEEFIQGLENDEDKCKAFLRAIGGTNYCVIPDTELCNNDDCYDCLKKYLLGEDEG